VSEFDAEGIKKKLEETERKVKEFLDSIGNPPNLVAIISHDEVMDETTRHCAASTNVTENLLMPHYEMLISGLISSLADHDHHKAAHLLAVAAAATHREIERYQQERVRRNPPHTLN
jgi:hypothetical protein